MCGIFGYVGKGADKIDFKAIIAQLKHRGPDEVGYWHNDTVSLVHTRLSIVGIANGRQPIVNEDGNKVLVCNGEIYNHKELKHKLCISGHRFATDSDNEVILHGIEAYGTKFINDLDGMFAFAYYDSSKDTMIIARDFFGIKPLYYYYKDGIFVFSSEIVPIIMALRNSTFSIDTEAIEHYLCFRYFPAPLTPFKEIRAVRPGHYITYNIKTKKILFKQYFDIIDLINCGRKVPCNVSKLEENIKSEVEKRFMGEVSLGTYLSGGLDSTLISYFMHKLCSKVFRTYAIRFSESEEDDDAYYAEKVSYDMGWDIKTVESEPKDFKMLSGIIKNMGIPFGDSALIPTAKLSAIAVKEVKFVLTGEGADEAFGGYPYYRTIGQQIDFNMRLPNKLRRYLSNHIKPIKSDISEIVISNLAVFSTNERKKYFHRCTLSLARANVQRVFSYDRIDTYTKLMMFDIVSWLNADLLLKLDSATMAYGLEGRVPYVSRGIYLSAFGFKGTDKIHKNDVKIPLKKIAERYLPTYVIKRKKHGFNVPMPIWLAEYQSTVYDLFENRDVFGIFNKIFSHDLLDDLKNDLIKKGESMGYSLAQKIWNMYCLGIWAEFITTQIDVDLKVVGV